MNQDGLNSVGFLVVQNRIGVSNINPAFLFYPLYTVKYSCKGYFVIKKIK